jgi:transposase InsO family protein
VEPVALCDLIRQYYAAYSIWMDNGKEFEGAFQSILKERDIRHVYSAPYSSQQNGKCKRF